MQTFLPYPSFVESMQVLDPSRLGNQVYREGVTLLRGGWRNHPAAKMWRGHMPALATYLVAGVTELRRRGHDYDGRPWHTWLFNYWQQPEVFDRRHDMPDWLGDPDFHSRHRSALLYKYPEYYAQFRWEDEPKLDYIWPDPCDECGGAGCWDCRDNIIPATPPHVFNRRQLSPLTKRT